MSGCPVLLHEHDEYLDRSSFLNGIKVYEELIPALANAPLFDVEEKDLQQSSSKRQKD